MTPIEKNIIVVDESGNKYEATWPKRAKGLVKNGRARFLNDNTICLTCPPEHKMEGKTMSEHNSKLTVNYILEQIEHIANDTEHLQLAIDALREIGNADVPGDISGQSKANALGNIVSSREETNRQLLAAYRMMFQLLTSAQTQPE